MLQDNVLWSQVFVKGMKILKPQKLQDTVKNCGYDI